MDTPTETPEARTARQLQENINRRAERDAWDAAVKPSARRSATKSPRGPGPKASLSPKAPTAPGRAARGNEPRKELAMLRKIANAIADAGDVLQRYLLPATIAILVFAAAAHDVAAAREVLHYAY